MDPAATTADTIAATHGQTASRWVDTRLFRDAGAVFALWVLALIVLVVTTANPPQVNLAQLSRATLMVTARVVDPQTGECAILRSFSPGKLPERITVTNLAKTPAQADTAYLLPLARDVAGPDGSYRVVDVPELDLPPLVYPAGPEIESQVEAWQRPPH
jgi:hypothetical protein